MPPNAPIGENLNETFQGLNKVLEAGDTFYLQEQQHALKRRIQGMTLLEWRGKQ